MPLITKLKAGEVIRINGVRVECLDRTVLRILDPADIVFSDGRALPSQSRSDYPALRVRHAGAGCASWCRARPRSQAATGVGTTARPVPQARATLSVQPSRCSTRYNARFSQEVA